jgi:hypothetical protein
VRCVADERIFGVCRRKELLKIKAAYSLIVKNKGNHYANREVVKTCLPGNNNCLVGVLPPPCTVPLNAHQN